jgi:hypothetical protein
LLRYFFFIAEDLDQFPFVYGGAHGGGRGEKLFCDHSPSLKLIWPNIGTLILSKPENKDGDRLPAQEDDSPEAAGLAFAIKRRNLCL